jgi:tetratricopeptide (TPR) repeat protein
MKLKFYYILFLLWSYQLHGTPIDSLHQLLNQTEGNPQEFLTTHLQLADALRKQSSDAEAANHIAIVEEQLTQHNFPIIRVHLLLTKGLLAYSQYKDEEALDLFEQGYKLNQQYQAGFCVDFCINLSKVTATLEAEEYLRKGLNCASAIGDTIAVQRQFGNLYTREKQYEKALVFYNNNQQLAESIKDTLVESNSYQDIGGVYLIEGKWKQAADYYLESATLKEKITPKSCKFPQNGASNSPFWGNANLK